MENDSDIEAKAFRPSRAPWLLMLLSFLACGGLGYAAWKALQSAEAAQAARADAVKRGDAAEKALGELEQKLADAETQHSALEAEKAALATKTEQLQANLDETAAELQKLKATADSLQEKLKAEIGRGDVKLTQTGDRIQVDLVDKILFDSGEAVLSDKGKEVIGRLASVLKGVEDKQIQVSGHTDDSPIKNEKLLEQFPTNWELSVARAVNVVRTLTESGGVPAQRVLAAGYGQFHPIATNATPAGRAQNRRIEILLTPSLTAKKGSLPVPPPPPAVAAAPSKAAPPPPPAAIKAPPPAKVAAVVAPPKGKGAPPPPPPRPPGRK